MKINELRTARKLIYSSCNAELSARDRNPRQFVSMDWGNNKGHPVDSEAIFAHDPTVLDGIGNRMPKMANVKALGAVRTAAACGVQGHETAIWVFQNISVFHGSTFQVRFHDFIWHKIILTLQLYQIMVVLSNGCELTPASSRQGIIDT